MRNSLPKGHRFNGYFPTYWFSEGWPLTISVKSAGHNLHKNIFIPFYIVLGSVEIGEMTDFYSEL